MAYFGRNFAKDGSRPMTPRMEWTGFQVRGPRQDSQIEIFSTDLSGISSWRLGCDVSHTSSAGDDRLWRECAFSAAVKRSGRLSKRGDKFFV